jgi:hypothetical protein
MRRLAADVQLVASYNPKDASSHPACETPGNLFHVLTSYCLTSSSVSQKLNTAELHLTGCFLSETWIIRISLALRVNLLGIYKTNLPSNYRLSDQVQCSVVAYRTANQARSKCLAAVHTVNSNSRTANCQCSLLSNKDPIIRGFCLSEWLAVPVNPDKWRFIAVAHRSVPLVAYCKHLIQQ